jgi:hypothetical protein
LGSEKMIDIEQLKIEIKGMEENIRELGDSL